MQYRYCDHDAVVSVRGWNLILKAWNKWKVQKCGFPFINFHFRGRHTAQESTKVIEMKTYGSCTWPYVQVAWNTWIINTMEEIGQWQAKIWNKCGAEGVGGELGVIFFTFSIVISSISSQACIIYIFYMFLHIFKSYSLTKFIGFLLNVLKAVLCCPRPPLVFKAAWQ